MTVIETIEIPNPDGVSFIIEITDRPMHWGPLPGEHYYACTQPERPLTEHTWYDIRCHGCVRHAEASVHVLRNTLYAWGGGPHRRPRRLPAGATPLWAMVEAGKYWLDIP